MKAPLVVAIDGPAAVGKGTLARSLSQVLEVPYLDTGLLYRAVARKMLDAGLDPAADDGGPIAQQLQEQDWKRDDLRTHDISRNASQVASQPSVRAALLDIQRDFVKKRGGVLDGRDIGTVVCPDAPVKLYITASPRERAWRRWLQLGGDIDSPDRQSQIDAVREAICERDKADASREVAPLRMAQDAHVINTDGLGAEQVLEEALKVVWAYVCEKESYA